MIIVEGNYDIKKYCRITYANVKIFRTCNHEKIAYFTKFCILCKRIRRPKVTFFSRQKCVFASENIVSIKTYKILNVL